MSASLFAKRTPIIFISKTGKEPKEEQKMKSSVKYLWANVQSNNELVARGEASASVLNNSEKTLT